MDLAIVLIHPLAVSNWVGTPYKDKDRASTLPAIATKLWKLPKLVGKNNERNILNF
jgi:hypothetical protein